MLLATAQRSRRWEHVAAIILSALVLLWVVGGFLDLIAPWVPAAAAERIGQSLSQALAPELESQPTPQSASAAALLTRLAKYTSLPTTPTLAVLRSGESNAFLLPGARLLLTSGFLESTQSNEELAFVIGHLLAHARQRDDLKVLGRGLVVMLGLDFLGVRREGIARAMLDNGVLTHQHFSNRQEADADRYSLWLLMQVFGRVDGARDFFHRLDIHTWPTGHFTEPVIMAQARKRSLNLIIREENWGEPVD